MRRVFDVCHGCRRCCNLCDSFPTLFTLIDNSKNEDVASLSSNQFAPIVASSQCLINIAKSICGFKSAKLVDTLEIPYEKTYPHFLPETKVDKIGLFEFSK